MFNFVKDNQAELKLKKRISQRDIAKILGVNVSTVSRALKGLGGVGAELRKKIERLAEEQSYRPASGWNGGGIQEDFAKKFIEHDGNSPRRRACFLTEDEWLYEMEWNSDKNDASLAEKKADPNRGINPDLVRWGNQGKVNLDQIFNKNYGGIHKHVPTVFDEYSIEGKPGYGKEHKLFATYSEVDFNDFSDKYKYLPFPLQSRLANHLKNVLGWESLNGADE